MLNSDEILTELLKRGIVTQETLQEVSADIPSEALKACADMLHTMTCPEDHENTCAYYKEEALEGAHWKKDTHKKWLELIRKLKEFLTIENDDDMMSTVREATEIINKESADAILIASVAQNMYTDADINDFRKIFAKVVEENKRMVSVHWTTLNELLRRIGDKDLVKKFEASGYEFILDPEPCTMEDLKTPIFPAAPRTLGELLDPLSETRV